MKFKVFGLSALLIACLVPPAHASAGYLPVRMGEILPVEACLPGNVHSPISLLVFTENNRSITVAKIKFKKLFKDSYCTDPHSTYDGSYQLKYSWKVSAFGSLSFYDSKARKSYLGWPDGIQDK